MRITLSGDPTSRGTTGENVFDTSKPVAENCDMTFQKQLQ